MRPAARLQTAIEFLDEIEQGDRPADAILADGFRKRRFAGSKDRAAIGDLVYGVLRGRGALDWALEHSSIEVGSRNRVLLQSVQIQGLDSLQFDVEPHAPEPVGKVDKERLAAATGKLLQTHSLDGLKDRNTPAWMATAFQNAFGDGWVAEAKAYTHPATVDLRVNTIQSDRATVRKALLGADIDTVETHYAPYGLRMIVRKPINGFDLYREGAVEVQDEGSQIASLLADARPGMKVVDFCAGAGGKSLAMAATMENRGRIIACDTAKTRLDRAAQRFKRAGAHMIERRVLSSERDKWIGRRAGKFDGGFDRVLVDAPCTGLGRLRRNPEVKWRVSPEDVQEQANTQLDILKASARLVARGGRLVYVTCSWLCEENEAPVSAFLKMRDDFFIHDLRAIWRETLGGEAPPDLAAETGRLTPARHKTDGFTITILGRKL